MCLRLLSILDQLFIKIKEKNYMSFDTNYQVSKVYFLRKNELDFSNFYLPLIKRNITI